MTDKGLLGTRRHTLLVETTISQVMATTISDPVSHGNHIKRRGDKPMCYKKKKDENTDKVDYVGKECSDCGQITMNGRNVGGGWVCNKCFAHIDICVVDGRKHPDCGQCQEVHCARGDTILELRE